jgi:hypothetical protein
MKYRTPNIPKQRTDKSALRYRTQPPPILNDRLFLILDLGVNADKR